MAADQLGFFYGVLDSVLPSDGVLVVLKAYFDASTREETGTFTIAGYAFAPAQVKKFDKEWWGLFGEYGGCHMTDLANEQKAFLGIGREEGARLIKEAVKIINRRVSYGVVISCNLREIDPSLPQWLRHFDQVYPVCCHWAMMKMGRFVAESGKEEIAYFFESGDQHAGSAHDFMGYVDQVPELKESYQHGSHSFITKGKALALQAADVLAWEWGKYLDETHFAPIRPMRASLKALIVRQDEFYSRRYAGNHITGEWLTRWVGGVERIAFSQIDEEAMDKASIQLDRDWKVLS